MSSSASKEEKTFELQNSFPPLPLPSLDETLEKYLKSVRVFLSEREYESTKVLVERFRNGQGAILHQRLKEKASQSRNWVSEWWEDGAYLEGRYPSYPLVNFGGASPDYKHFPPRVGSQLERAGLFIHHLCRYWTALRRETIPIMKNRGTPWCMNQVHRLFNTCKVPGLTKDTLHHYFKTVAEGSCPSHIVVQCGGRLWKMESLNPDGHIFTPPQMTETLRLIREEADKRQGSYINALTCWDRVSWYKLGFDAIAGDPQTQFADKCMNYVFHKNGLLVTCNDHANVDAIVSMALSNWINKEIEKDGHKWPGSMDSSGHNIPQELHFTLDSSVTDGVKKAIETCRKLCSDLSVEVVHYDKYANGFFRANKIYGDTIIQLALQLAYFRLHKKPGPTYETASTRKFYHGRTETVRSCTPESVEWTRSVLCPSTSPQTREENFRRALRAHDGLMEEATEGRGCDRHLFGLRRLAGELGEREPEMFRDSAWRKSGGDGNFVLSTSFVGYSNVWGGVAPMCTDGYGSFYKMQDKKITFFVATWKSSEETNIHAFIESLWWALDHIYDLPISTPSAKL